MSILRIDASIQGDRSFSSALADVVQHEITLAHPDEPVISRHLGNQPLPSDAWQTATLANFVDPAERSEAQRNAIALAQTLANELTDADAAVLALPLYNWACPSTSRPGSIS